jgi:GT2 family glycosyltransferase
VIDATIGPAAPDVSIVVVSYNSQAYLRQALEPVSGGPYEVIVVDNASTDGTRLLVRSDFPSVRLLELDANIGFGAACNEGMRIARGRYFLLMNPDAWPVGDAVAELVGFADPRPRLGATGPVLRFPDGRPQRSSFGTPSAFWLGAPAFTSSPSTRTRRPRGAIVLVGAALLLRRGAVAEIGGFDPRFFMFNEEVDLCTRLRRASWEIEPCPTAAFVHVGGASTSQVASSMYREQLRGHLLYLAKHRGMRQAEVARRVLLASTRVRAARSPISAMFAEAASWLASGNARTLIEDRLHAAGAA